jgi:hypothetical protein
VGASTARWPRRRVSPNFVKNYEIPLPSLGAQDAALEQIAEQKALIGPLRILVENLQDQMRKKMEFQSAGAG